jgi:tRNA-2-methylthio-N6-dimethylallyladenosine synthase
MPVQSGSDDVLKRMFRWYTVEQYKEFIDQIRSLKRKISITTDMILWFPDETEDDFIKSLDLIEYSNFDMIYMSLYSPRPWTYWAKNYSDNIPYKTKHDRWSRMNDLLNKISFSNNQQELWKIKKMMISWIENNKITWYLDNMKNVLIKTVAYKNYSIWEFINVEIIEAESLRLNWKIKN